MPIAARFYRSLYVTLGLACACLGYSELAFLPEMAVFAAVVGVLLVVAYRAEGRWSLTIRSANYVGIAITLGAVAYVAFQFVRPVGTSLIDTLPWPTSLLPFLGPLLMVLVPAKLFRPKHVGDFWSLHGIGLIAVALGCALAGDPMFGFLLLLYLISFVWSLSLFYYFRQADPSAPIVSARSATPRILGRAGVWTLLGTLVAMVLFLATPRSGDARWEFSVRSGNLTTGLSDERPSIDLNNKGVVTLNRDLVFEVRAFAADDVTPKTDLSPDQRWRAVTFNYYENGRWEYRPDADHRERPPLRGTTGLEALEAPAQARVASVDGPPGGLRIRPNAVLPDLGSEQFFLRFYPQGRHTHTAILGEPVWRSPAGTPLGERRISVVSVGRDRQTAWFQGGDDELAPPAYGLVSAPNSYRQVVRLLDEPSVGPPVLVSDAYREHLCNVRSVPTLRVWTHDLVRSMAKSGIIAKAALGPGITAGEPIRVPPNFYEAVARALKAYLASSSEFKYSLVLQRQDERLDPVEDFLINTKVGHCQRFATALVLMLRAVGVPARVVLGYRGFETDGNGVYEVQQCHAHAWVEALIQRSASGNPTWHWFTLDPTPEMDETASTSFSFGQWLESVRNNASSFFRYFLVEYDADQQGRARSWLGRIDWAATLLGTNENEWWRPVVLMSGIAGLVFGIRRWRRRDTIAVATNDPAFALYARLRDLIRKWMGLEPRCGQTPEEFARAATARLVQRPTFSMDPTLPSETVVAYYRVRYGREVVTEEERSGLAQRLDRFEADLGRGDVRFEPGAG
jgi:protein-glutamine gamma-glutamyltransferase